MNPKTMTWYPHDSSRLPNETRMGCLCACQHDDGQVYIGWSSFNYKYEVEHPIRFQLGKPTQFNKKLARDMAMGRAIKGRTEKAVPGYMRAAIASFRIRASKTFDVKYNDIIVVNKQEA